MKALIVTDIQNDFVEGGALAVPGGQEIVPVVNELMEKFDLVVGLQDWHPPDHGSFVANHEGKNVGDVIELNGLDQILWPVHCVKDEKGAEFVKDLNVRAFKKIFQKGTDRKIDSYSGFFDNARQKETGLGDYLKGKGVNEVYIVGLATDYCVKFTALDAVALGFKTHIVLKGTRGVEVTPGDVDKAVLEMETAGVTVHRD